MRVLVVLLLVACGNDDPEGPICTTEARASVQVTVTDAKGAPVVATGMYTVDGGLPAACEAPSAGELVCGFEQVGAFEVTVSAEGYGDETVTTDVEADECHVVTEQLAVEMFAL